MNPILLQKQLKENASDLQDFCKDLKNWGEEMKLKEESLKNKDNTKKQKVQGAKASPKIKDGPKEKVSRIGSTDYAKWEKFDADLECERLEDDIKDDSELTDEFEESARDEALVHKEKGNSFVKKQEWDKAIECYTKAINCYAYDPVFYANRALCYLKKGNFLSAEEDCTLSLRLDSSYVKALQRRAAAKESLGKLEQAKNDLELVLTHEPKNKESMVVLERIKKKIGAKEKPVENEQRPVSKFTASRSKLQTTKPIIKNSATKSYPVDTKSDVSSSSTSGWPDPGSDIIHVKAINKPPHVRSTKPLKRVEIIEVNSCSKINEESSSENPEALKKHVVEHVKQVTFQDDIVDASEPIEKTSMFRKSRQKPIGERNEPIINDKGWPKTNLNNNIIRSDDLEVVEKKCVPESKPKEEKNTENVCITKMDGRTVENRKDEEKNNESLYITKMDSRTVDNRKDEENNTESLYITKIDSRTVENRKNTTEKVVTVDSSNKELPVPKTSVQFYSTWKTIKNLEDKYRYLKLIDPKGIPNIFRESLDSSVFSSILEVLSTSFIENEDDVYDFLFHLTQVKRFSALAMFMDSTDKNRLWKLITYLKEQNCIPNEKVDNLILEYEL